MNSKLTFFVFLVTVNLASFAIGQGINLDDLLAGLRQNSTVRPRIEADVLYVRNFPDAVRILESQLASLRLVSESDLSEDVSTEFGAMLQNQLLFAKTVASWSKVVRIREYDNQLLCLELSRIGKPALSNSTDFSTLLPISFQPIEWTTRFEDRIQLFVIENGKPSIRYSHDDQLNSYQFFITEDPPLAMQDWSKSNFCGFPFEIKIGNDSLFEFALSDFLLSTECQIERDDDGNWTVEYQSKQRTYRFVVTPEQPITYSEITRITLSSKDGYVPKTITKRQRYFQSGIPISVHHDWDKVGKTWEIEIGKIGSHSFPRKIHFTEMAAISSRNSVPAVWLNVDQFKKIYESPFEEDVQLVCRENRSIEVTGVKELGSSNKTIIIDIPDRATVVDIVRNKMVIPRNN